MLLGTAAVVLTSAATAALYGLDDVPVRWMCVFLVLVAAAALVAACFREWIQGTRFCGYRAAWRAAGREGSTQGLNTDHGEGRDGVASQVVRRIGEAIVFVLSVAVAVVGPAVAIYYTSQLHEVLPIDIGALFRFEDPFANASEAARNSPATWELLVGHTAQWILVAVASLVPAAMYFQFDRDRLAAIQGRWVRQVFRLDPTVRSLGDVQSKYGAQMEASFGRLAPGSSARYRRGRRSPVIVATILITIGWIVLATGSEVPTLVFEDGRYEWPGGTFPVVDFFLPQGTALGFAFLGAYLFTLFHIVRAYHRRDLVPKTYNTIVVRFLAAYILTLAAEAFLPGEGIDDRAVIGFAFFAGFLPQSALVRLREAVTIRNPKNDHHVLAEKAPLTELEGIDLYDRTRLAEEGINNVHALAHADIVELMSSTRISADRLVDWVDQAILFLRVGGDHMHEHAEGDESDESHELTVTRANLVRLRRFGIRNASDLVQSYEAAVARGMQEAEAAATAKGLHSAAPGDVRESIRREVDQLRTTLSTSAMAPDGSGYLPVQGMLDTLPDEEWFTQIRNWRWSEFGACEAWCWYIDGRWPYPKLPSTLPERVRGLQSQKHQHMFTMPPPAS